MEARSRERWLRYFGLALLGGIVGGALVWMLMNTTMISAAPSPGAASIAGAPTTDLEARIESVYQSGGPSVVNITNRSFTFDYYMNPIPREGTGSGFFY